MASLSCGLILVVLILVGLALCPGTNMLKCGKICTWFRETNEQIQGHTPNVMHTHQPLFIICMIRYKV